MLDVVIKFLIGHLVAALMLSIGLETHWSSLAEIVRRPQLYVRALGVFVLGVPLLAMAIVSGLALPRVAAGLVLLMAICPGAPFIPFSSRSKGAKFSPVGLNLLVVASVVVPITIPLWLAALERVYPYGFHFSSLLVLKAVLQTVIVPLALGMLIRAAAPRVAEPLGKVVHVFFLVALAAAAVVALVRGAPVLLELTPRVLVGALLVVAGSAVLGLWAAHGDRDAQRPAALAAVLGNPGLALAIIVASYPGFQAAAFVIAYVILRRLAFVPIDLWIKKHRHAHP